MERRSQMFVYRPFRFSLSLVPRSTKGLFTVHRLLVPNRMAFCMRMRQYELLKQSRSQSIRYFCPADRATNALEESKTGTTKSWFRFNCACVKLFTHLTKRRSEMQGKFSLLAHCCNFLFPSSFSSVTFDGCI